MENNLCHAREKWSEHCHVVKCNAKEFNAFYTLVGKTQ